jgi:prepilin-type N-terminal cleavage/methylation domain-containing protein
VLPDPAKLISGDSITQVELNRQSCGRRRLGRILMMQRKRPMFTICKNNSGFSFIELMAVMAILGILAHIAITSFITTRTKVLDAAAFAETQSLGKAVLNSFLDGIDVNLAHNEGGGREIGTMDTSGGGRKPIFIFSTGMQAQISGNSNVGGARFRKM